MMESNKLYESLCLISNVRGKQKLKLIQQQRGIHIRFDTFNPVCFLHGYILFFT